MTIIIILVRISELEEILDARNTTAINKASALKEIFSIFFPNRIEGRSSLCSNNLDSDTLRRLFAYILKGFRGQSSTPFSMKSRRETVRGPLFILLRHKKQIETSKGSRR